VYLSVGLCVSKAGLLVVEVLLTGEPVTEVDFVVVDVLLMGGPVLRFPRVVVVLDDSLMCGTMSSKIVRLLREAGARTCASPTRPWWVHASTTSTPSDHMDLEDVRQLISIDSLAFLLLHKLHGTCWRRRGTTATPISLASTLFC
jgi:hypothetical protein